MPSRFPRRLLIDTVNVQRTTGSSVDERGIESNTWTNSATSVKSRFTLLSESEDRDGRNTVIKNFNLGYDPKLFTSKLLSKYFINNNLISVDQNLIDQIFRFKEKHTKPFYSLDKKIVGETYLSLIHI